jgi:hypothetical protein
VDGPLAPRRQNAVQAKAQRDRVAAESKFNHFPGDRLGLAIEQRFGGERGPVSRTLGLAPREADGVTGTVPDFRLYLQASYL